MRKLISGLTLFSFVFMLLGVPTPTYALSCAGMPSIEAAFENYDGVIVGQVDAAIRKDELNEVWLTVTVRQSFKGIEEDEVMITENATWGGLYGQSMVGEAYLFYLTSDKGVWEHPLCAPTKQLSAASEELEYLRDKEIPIEGVMGPTGTSGKEANWAAYVVFAGILIGMIVFISVRKRKRSKR